MTHDEIKLSIVDYLKAGNPLLDKSDKIPFDQSLVKLGYIDSFGVIDIVTFLEGTYSIEIHDDEINAEKFGSINKMVELVSNKLSG